MGKLPVRNNINHVSFWDRLNQINIFISCCHWFVEVYEELNMWWINILVINNQVPTEHHATLRECNILYQEKCPCETLLFTRKGQHIQGVVQCCSRFVLSRFVLPSFFKNNLYLIHPYSMFRLDICKAYKQLMIITFHKISGRKFTSVLQKYPTAIINTRCS